jgi:hypothetical protein
VLLGIVAQVTSLTKSDKVPVRIVFNIMIKMSHSQYNATSCDWMGLVLNG